MNFVNASFRSPGFDYHKVLEILNENRHYANHLTKLSSEIFDRYGINITLRIWNPPKSTSQVYLYVNDKDSGFVISEKLQFELFKDIITSKGSCKNPDVIEFLIDEITNLSEGMRGQALKAKLESPYHETATLVPLKKVLDNLGEGESGSVVIALDNSVLAKMANDYNIELKELEDLYKYSSGPKDFAQQAQRLFTNKTNADIPSETNLTDAFMSARMDSDTYKAVYRLAVLGIIEDYTIDYRTSVIEAQVRRLSSADVTDRLKNYITRYAPLSLPEFISPLPKQPTIEDCLHQLISFVYKRIKAQREEALKVMDQTAEKGLEDEKAFEDAIVLYFDSKLLPVLRRVRDKYTAEDIKKIILETENASAQLAHLLGAANRLLPEVPDNAAYHYLRAYAMEGMSYSRSDINQELNEARRLFTLQGWTKKEIADLCLFGATTISNTHKRSPDPFLTSYYEYHRDSLAEIHYLTTT